jgi:hypothetical protein
MHNLWRGSHRTDINRWLHVCEDEKGSRPESLWCHFKEIHWYNFKILTDVSRRGAGSMSCGACLHPEFFMLKPDDNFLRKNCMEFRTRSASRFYPSLITLSMAPVPVVFPFAGQRPLIIA